MPSASRETQDHPCREENTPHRGLQEDVQPKYGVYWRALLLFREFIVMLVSEHRRNQEEGQDGSCAPSHGDNQEQNRELRPSRCISSVREPYGKTQAATKQDRAERGKTVKTGQCPTLAAGDGRCS